MLVRLFNLQKVTLSQCWLIADINSDRLPVIAFQAFLREPPNDMPAFSTAALSGQEAADLRAFRRTLPGRKPAKDFPLLNQ
jgi:hypothetical protein